MQQSFVVRSPAYVVYSKPVYTSRVEPRSDVIDRRNAEIVGRLPFDGVSFSSSVAV